MPLPFLFTNFTAAERKPGLIPFNYFGPNDSISWIQGMPAAALTALSGAIDGSNAVFTASGPPGEVLKNGVVQELGVMYTVSGQTVTFIDPFIPQPGDYLQARTG